MIAGAVLCGGRSTRMGRDKASLPVDGAVRALASRRHGANAYLAAALEDAGGGFRLALFEMAPRK